MGDADRGYTKKDVVAESMKGQIQAEEDSERTRISWHDVIGNFEKSNFQGRILKLKGRSKIGQQLLRLVGSGPIFFSIGLFAVVLKDAGTVSEKRVE